MREPQNPSARRAPLSFRCARRAPLFSTSATSPPFPTLATSPPFRRNPTDPRDVPPFWAHRRDVPPFSPHTIYMLAAANPTPTTLASRPLRPLRPKFRIPHNPRIRCLRQLLLLCDNFRRARKPGRPAARSGRPDPRSTNHPCTSAARRAAPRRAAPPRRAAQPTLYTKKSP